MRESRGTRRGHLECHLHLLRDLPPETAAEVVVKVRLPGDGQLVVPCTMTVAEVQARFGARGLVSRGRPWAAEEVGQMIGKSGDTVRRWIRKDPQLRAIARAYREGSDENPGAWRFPEEWIQDLIDASPIGRKGSNHGVVSGDRPEATEPRYPSPPASEASERGIAELNEWREEYDGR